MRTIFTRLLFPVLFASPLLAQSKLQTPWPSPAATVTHTIGTTAVAIEYHRPGVKGREIWGGLVPYDEVWRTGANEATTIHFDDPVKLDGHDVPAGTYAFFAIPTKTKWTLILNKQAKQWGAFNYDVREDLLRWDVTPKSVPATEWMTYTIDPLSAESAAVHLIWAKFDVAFTITVDVKKIVSTAVERALAEAKSDDWAILAQGAKYYSDTDYKLDLALSWIEESLKIKEQFRSFETQGQILHKLKRDPQAIAALEKAMALAKTKAPASYVDGLAKLVLEWKKG